MGDEGLFFFVGAGLIVGGSAVIYVWLRSRDATHLFWSGTRWLSAIVVVVLAVIWDVGDFGTRSTDSSPEKSDPCLSAPDPGECKFGGFEPPEGGQIP